MKTLKRVTKKKKSAILMGSILSIILSVSPLQGSDKPGNDGGDIYIKERVSIPIEVRDADYETGPEIEEWMILPFEVRDSEYETGLEIEEWMTIPFEVREADYETRLEIEEWMTVSWI